MADKTPAPLTDPPASDAPAEAPTWFGPALDKWLGRLFDSGRAEVVEAPAAPRGDPAKPAPADVEGDMKKAIDDVLSARERQTADDQEKAALKAEVDRLKSLIEKAPREFKAVTRFMWGDDDG